MKINHLNHNINVTFKTVSKSGEHKSLSGPPPTHHWMYDLGKCERSQIRGGVIVSLVTAALIRTCSHTASLTLALHPSVSHVLTLYITACASVRAVIHCLSWVGTHTRTHTQSKPEAGLSSQLWCLTYTNALSHRDQLRRWRLWWSKISWME